MGSGPSRAIVRRCVLMQAILIGKWCMIGLVVLLLGEQQRTGRGSCIESSGGSRSPGGAASEEYSPADGGPAECRSLLFLQREQIDFPIYEQLDEGYLRGHAQTGRRRAGWLSDVRDGPEKRHRSIGEHRHGGHDVRVLFPGDCRVLFSSTYASGPNCPPKPKREGAYRWALR